MVDQESGKGTVSLTSTLRKKLLSATEQNIQIQGEFENLGRGIEKFVHQKQC